MIELISVTQHYGGLLDTRRFVRVMPYFQRPIGDIDTFLAGQSLARFLKQLDAVASENGVRPLSSFGFNDDLRGETLLWHPPAEGLRTVTTMLNCLEHSADRNDIPVGILEDLGKWRHALERAKAENVAFCILLRHGNSTSGHEWSVRKGSAF